MKNGNGKRASIFKKINRNLSAIIYRYLFQIRINQVIEEYHNEFFIDNYDGSVCTRSVFKFYSGGPETRLFYCWRDLNDVESHIMIMKNAEPYNAISFKKKTIKFLCQSDERLHNYVYTSTKYLRQIKESGVNCLSIIR
jgi:hypothetical protein